jgi:hypothetical protein
VLRSVAGRTIPHMTALSPKRLLAALGIVLALTIVAQIVNANVFSNSSGADKYGKVDIPGSAVLKLPSGSLDVMVEATDNTPVELPHGVTLTVTPVGGGAPAVLTRDRGGQFGMGDRVATVSFRRIWRLETPHAGAYRVTAGGVKFTDDPRNLALGHSPPAAAGKIWEVGGVVMLLVALLWEAARLWTRDRRSPAPSGLPGD